ncbi:unnamed protein product [Menidia menidia]|uniref:(Atlantic silverside) hypothetical protein n=1 Tax=Menidia menidia TaxID=238744 RepID=A0A8S4BCB5_9TELE|nr:unnamed protein product [Menidia menidia]
MSPTPDRKPSFPSGLIDTTAASDSIVKLSVKATGEPKPAISWMKDGKVLSQGGKYEIFEDHGSAHLEIYESEVSDSGTYKCTASNSTGTVSTTCSVTVRDTRAKAEISEEVLKRELIHEEISSTVRESSQISVSEVQSVRRTGLDITEVSAFGSEAPAFLLQPRSQNVNEGQSVRFTCEIAGEPSPEPVSPG